MKCCGMSGPSGLPLGPGVGTVSLSPEKWGLWPGAAEKAVPSEADRVHLDVFPRLSRAQWAPSLAQLTHSCTAPLSRAWGQRATQGTWSYPVRGTRSLHPGSPDPSSQQWACSFLSSPFTMESWGLHPHPTLALQALRLPRGSLSARHLLLPHTAPQVSR